MEGRPDAGPAARCEPAPPSADGAPGRPAPGCASRGGLRLGSRRASPGAAGGRSLRAPCGWVRVGAGTRGVRDGCGAGAPLVPGAVLHRARRPRCALSWDRAERARVGSAFGAGVSSQRQPPGARERGPGSQGRRAPAVARQRRASARRPWCARAARVLAGPVPAASPAAPPASPSARPRPSRKAPAPRGAGGGQRASRRRRHGSRKGE